MRDHENYRDLGEYLSQMATTYDFAEFFGSVSLRSPRSCDLTCGDDSKRFILSRQTPASYRVTSVSNNSPSRDFDMTFVVAQPLDIRYYDTERTLEITLSDELSLRIRPHHIRF